MRIISIVNLKGGVGKTTTTINMASILSVVHGKKVLIVDNDVQANCTKNFRMHDYDQSSIEDIYRYDDVDMDKLVRKCGTGGADISLIPSNMNMDDAVTCLMKDENREQITRLGAALEHVRDEYDFCIIDNPPGIGLNVLNSIACTHDIIIPVKIDKHSLDGMEELMEVVEDMKEFNPNLKSVNCLVTMFYKELSSGDIVLRKSPYSVFEQKIRYSKKVNSWTFEGGSGLLRYSPRSSACIDYKKFVNEYLCLIEEEG